MEFKSINLDTYQIIKEYLKNQKYKISDYSFGILYMWRSYYKLYYCICNNILFLVSIDNQCINALLPLCRDELLGEAFTMLENFALEKKYCLNYNFIPEEKHLILQNKYNIIGFCEEQDFLYDAYKMATYQGKAYTAKRNHFNNFIKNNYSFEIIDQTIIPEVKIFLNEFLENNQKDNPIFQKEIISVEEVLDNYFDLPFIGAVIRVNNKIEAFTIAEIVNDTLMCHIEKGNKQIRGINEAIQKLFTNYIYENFSIKYVNREDDAGDIGLRKSKLSYKPITMLNKYRFNNIIKN